MPNPSQVENLIALFGSTKAVAEAAGVTDIAVRQWRRRGYVPTRNAHALLNAAKAKGLSLTAEDLLVDHSAPAPAA